jgi:carboxylesterase type B
VVTASAYGPQCPQSEFSIEPFGLNPGVIGDEDCLNLNVWAPTGAKKLPVLVYIHGGGYGAGNGQQDLTSIINTNGNSFVGVTIQYRVSFHRHFRSHIIMGYSLVLLAGSLLQMSIGKVLLTPVSLIRISL